jgi:hypothetical protein
LLAPLFVGRNRLGSSFTRHRPKKNGGPFQMCFSHPPKNDQLLSGWGKLLLPPSFFPSSFLSSCWAAPTSYTLLRGRVSFLDWYFVQQPEREGPALWCNVPIVLCV